MNWIKKILKDKPEPITTKPVMIGSAWLDKFLDKQKVEAKWLQKKNGCTSIGTK